MTSGGPLAEAIRRGLHQGLAPLDLVPGRGPVEKLVALALQGVPSGLSRVAALTELEGLLAGVDTTSVRLVVLGGGTGLANVVGGDSCRDDWPDDPFHGIKARFPAYTAVVCTTDDGGSSGELQKDFPIIGVGDLRHVLLAAVSEAGLQQRYRLDTAGAGRAARVLHRLCNHRFTRLPGGVEELAGGLDLAGLPEPLAAGIYRLLAVLGETPALTPALARPHCLGNLLLLAAAMEAGAPAPGEAMVTGKDLLAGIDHLAELLGVGAGRVRPATLTPGWLRVRYANGVAVRGEAKSARARRHCPVDRVMVEFAGPPQPTPGLIQALATADCIVFAPGSLYTSIIPVLQVPEIAAAIRANQRALKVLVANLWVQRGETDLVDDDPGRRYHVSDLLRAYHRNIPGGVGDLFQVVLHLGLRNIPGSVLQNYALEGKIPIYCDRDEVARLGFVPLEGALHSTSQLAGRNALQHDADRLARALAVLWAGRSFLPPPQPPHLPPVPDPPPPRVFPVALLPCRRYRAFARRLQALGVAGEERARLLDILWRHPDIPPVHLQLVQKVRRVPVAQWGRDQQWDNIPSFFDPVDGSINIRADVGLDTERFEVGFLVALGQSLLGDYAGTKEIRPVVVDGATLGKVYRLRLRPLYRCLLESAALDRYLRLARMVAHPDQPGLYTRLINGEEGFTPPGLLFGLVYAWYLDNRFASHVEYKMAAGRVALTDLVPEQARTVARRKAMIDFFRDVVFAMEEV